MKDANYSGRRSHFAGLIIAYINHSAYLNILTGPPMQLNFKTTSIKPFKGVFVCLKAP